MAYWRLIITTKLFENINKIPIVVEKYLRVLLMLHSFKMSKVNLNAKKKKKKINKFKSQGNTKINNVNNLQLDSQLTFRYSLFQ